ncbi:hypothetical protein [Aeromonas sp. 62-46]|uniref:hypothetical protein n=1 Tax=Aeromonas sp. 62-46 TaxID=1895698 RepID=UPI000A413CBF|nr:hypothetical protein [Aeromonas sp. 62-46]
MNLRQVADLAVARLGLPIPMAKLATIQAVAQALDCEDTALAFAEALADWASTRELESQCLEAICPLLIATPKPEVIALIRRAISRPSVASDALLSLVTGSPALVASWTCCHSGPATSFSKLDEEESQLRSGTFIPPSFSDQLERLESQSGRPFIRQWAYEFKILNDRHGGNGDGHLDYFFSSDRKNVGHFVAHRSHSARSAFLRTLAFAVQYWGMPIAIASDFSELAFPIEPIFLRFPPQNAPIWADKIQCHAASDAEDGPIFAESLIKKIEDELNGRLMHCSLAVVDEPRCHVEFEVFAIAKARDDLDTAQVIHFYKYLLGEITPDRDSLRAFVSPDMGCDALEPLGFTPLLLPLIGRSVGYLQSDIVSRVPYVPVSSRGLPNLKLVPKPEGAVFHAYGREVGFWGWWNWNWKPSSLRHQPSPTACYTSLDQDAARQLLEPLGGRMEYVWQIMTWTRESDYGDWAETKRSGHYKG